METILDDEPELCNLDTIDWPHEGHRIMMQATALLTMAILASVERARQHGNDAQLAGAVSRLLESERVSGIVNGLYYRRLLATAPRHRGHYSAQDRTLIMTLATEKCWTPKEVATKFAIDASQARHWMHEWLFNSESALFTGKRAWNSYDDALRDLTHRLRETFSEPEIGVRTIANYILKAAIATSPSTTRRYLRQPPPDATSPSFGSDINESKNTTKQPAPEPQPPAPVRYLARDKLNPVYTVRCIHHCGDPHLPVFGIQVSAKRKTA